MENWQIAELTEEQIAVIKNIEKELGVTLVAYDKDGTEELEN